MNEEVDLAKPVADIADQRRYLIVLAEIDAERLHSVVAFR